MLYFDRFDISEAIDVTKMSAAKECIICRYWHFYTKGLSFNQMSAIDVIMY